MVVTNLPCSSWFLPLPWPEPRPFRTHVSRGPTGRGEYTARVLHFGEAEVGDHDLGVFVQAVVQQILWLKGQEGGKAQSEAGQPVSPSTSGKQWEPKSRCSFTDAISVGSTRN